MLSYSQFFQQVLSAYLFQYHFYSLLLLALVPEEEETLFLLLAHVACAEYLFACFGIYAGVIHFGGHGHGGWREVLHLFKMEVQLLSLCREGCHALQRAARMAAYKIRYKLLVEVVFAVYAVEYFPELAELRE